MGQELSCFELDIFSIVDSLAYQSDLLEAVHAPIVAQASAMQEEPYAPSRLTFESRSVQL